MMGAMAYMNKSSRGFSLVLLLLAALSGCAASKGRVKDPTDLREYVESANSPRYEQHTALGSLWIENGMNSGLYRDHKARYINDVLTIYVIESTSAIASADARNSRGTNVSAGFDRLFGAEKVVRELPTMVSGRSSSSFEGTGSTSRATMLETRLTARVIEVLPNGFLVVEGRREVRVNNESQTVFLTGVVRPADINQNNVVLSSAVAQMSVRVEGQGVVSQPIKPGWLYRILTGILPF
jgi:flagellar L-ring protein FlgH